MSDSFDGLNVGPATTSLEQGPQNPRPEVADLTEQDLLHRAAVFQEQFSDGDGDEEQPKAVNPIGIVLRILRGRYHIVACLSLIFSVVGGIGGYLSKHPIYVSGGIIQVYPTRTNILYSDQDDSRLRLFDAFVAAEASFIRSPPVLERSVKSPQLAELKWSPDLDGMNRLKETVAVEKKGGLITVTTGHRDPVIAATLLNVVLKSYEDLQTERLKLQDSVRERELSLRETDVKTKLDELDKKIMDIGQEYGVNTIVEAHIRKITQSEDVDKRIAEVGLSISAMSTEKPSNDVDIGDAELKRLVVLDHALADMLFEQSKQKAELAVLLARHAPEHRDVIEMKARLAVIDQAIADRRDQLTTLGTTGALTKGGANEKQQSLEDLKGLQARLIGQRNAIQQEARDLNSRMIKMETLKDERLQLRSLLDETRKALEQIRLESQHMLPGTVEIKSRGVVSIQPAGDKRMMFGMAGCGFGAVGGLALTLAYGFVFGSYRFSDDLSEGRPSIPMVGVLPAVKDVPPDQSPDFQRAVYRLAVDLQLLMDTTPGTKVLAISGPGGGAGTSTVALALAKAFTNSRLHTVLVDADFADGALTNQLGLSGSAGLRECLLDGNIAGHLVDSETGLLRTLPLGSSKVVNDSQIARRQFALLLQQLKQDSDLVIVDLGPLKNRLVARLGSAIADRVLFVVPAGSPLGSVNPSLADLERLAPHRAMTVLNFASAKDPMLQAV